MKIKKGDKVLVITGKDRNKTGSVLKVFPKENKVLVEDINLSVRHLRPKRAGEKGQRVHNPSPLHISNVKIICPKCKKPTRINFEKQGKDKKRICKKCKAIID